MLKILDKHWLWIQVDYFIVTIFKLAYKLIISKLTKYIILKEYLNILLRVLCRFSFYLIPTNRKLGVYLLYAVTCSWDRTSIRIHVECMFTEEDNKKKNFFIIRVHLPLNLKFSLEFNKKLIVYLHNSVKILML